MGEIKIGRMVLGPCQTNCYFLYKNQEEQENLIPAILIDPADQGLRIYEGLLEKGFRIEAILLTHGHFDHIWGSRELRELSKAPIYALEEERALCEDAEKNVSAQAGRAYTIVPDFYIKDGEVLKLAGMSCQVIHTPGHTMGSCCYYFKEADLLMSGDTLFQESVGRTDLPTGSMGTLMRSIQEKLFVLPEETKVYPGHGDITTIGHEKKYNPFC